MDFYTFGKCVSREKMVGNNDPLFPKKRITKTFFEMHIIKQKEVWKETETSRMLLKVCEVCIKSSILLKEYVSYRD